MRYGIIADVHGNLEALLSVLDALSGRMDRIICLGDIIGYGPNPNECCDLIKRHDIKSVAGNHEKAALGEMPIEWFNPAAACAIRWTQAELTEPNREFIKGLPLTMEFGDFAAVHGGLVSPLEEYLENIFTAVPTFNLMRTRYLFVGHTHRPLMLNYGDKKIINPGSVGQPRDGDPRAAYVTFNPESGEAILHRVDYDIQGVQEKMRKAELPAKLIERLRSGM
ncbi:MAG TPA: metallophosphoesterase family protein [Candidatus Omnitrophota bacterium]|nr:metallophosphoesterase family protein [Candidatus Omnitrophota bacterium]